MSSQRTVFRYFHGRCYPQKYLWFYRLTTAEKWAKNDATYIRAYYKYSFFSGCIIMIYSSAISTNGYVFWRTELLFRDRYEGAWDQIESICDMQNETCLLYCLEGSVIVNRHEPRDLNHVNQTGKIP